MAASCVVATSHADFLRGRFAAFFFVGLGASDIHAGGSLAGNDSSEASSTGSTLSETSEEPGISLFSDFGERGFGLSAVLAIVIRSYICRIAQVIR